MTSIISVAPPNSLLCISDVSGGDVPEFKKKHLILATASFLTVACFMYQDGETTVSLGFPQEVAFGGEPKFDGVLDTPSRLVVVSTVEGESLLQASVSSLKTRVRIWVNHESEPDRIGIGLG